MAVEVEGAEVAEEEEEEEEEGSSPHSSAVLCRLLHPRPPRRRLLGHLPLPLPCHRRVEEGMREGVGVTGALDWTSTPSFGPVRTRETFLPAEDEEDKGKRTRRD